MKTGYRILTTVTLQHDYYKDGRCNDFEIVPSAATAKALKGAGILAKMIGNTLILLVKANDDKTPFTDIPADLKLSFYMQLNNVSFVNFTNVPFQFANSIFYFTNINQNKIGNVRFLSKQLPVFANNNYAIGDIVSDNMGHAYENIKPVANGNHLVTDANYWHPRTNAQYAGNIDQLRITDGRVMINTPPAKLFNISIYTLNAATLKYDIPFGNAQQSFSEDQTAISIDLKNLKPGKYNVVVNGVSNEMYIDANAAYQRIFGIIELYNTFDWMNDFGWLKADKTSKELDHVIAFANRLVIWKYIVHSNEITAVEDTDAPGAFVAATVPLNFVSVQPLPMSEQVITSLQLMKGATILTHRLANPLPDRVTTYTDNNNNTYYCSEMYLRF